MYNPSDSLLVLNQPSQSPTNSIYKSLSRLWRYKTAYFSGIGMLLDTIYDLRETIEKLSQAMDFRTDSLVLIIEDEKVSMRGLLRNNPDFAKKFETVISIPVFTNDELVTFARTYARENGYKMDEMGVLALYTQIGNNQKEGEPMTISQVKDMVDRAIAHAEKGTRKFGRRMSRKHTDADDRVILYEKDFEF